MYKLKIFQKLNCIQLYHFVIYFKKMAIFLKNQKSQEIPRGRFSKKIMRFFLIKCKYYAFAIKITVFFIHLELKNILSYYFFDIFYFNIQFCQYLFAFCFSFISFINKISIFYKKIK